jgi:hypothetical protein
MKLAFSRQILEKYITFMKIHPVEAELFHADGWRDKTKLKIDFRKFPNAPKESKLGVIQDVTTSRITQCALVNIF